MDYIKYETTLKASGREYSKIVFWNRFIRNPIELILTWLPAAITIVCIALGCFSSYLAVIYAACWCYPIYIFGFQFKSSVNYHLKNRDASESAPCGVCHGGCHVLRKSAGGSGDILVRHAGDGGQCF